MADDQQKDKPKKSEKASDAAAPGGEVVAKRKSALEKEEERLAKAATHRQQAHGPTDKLSKEEKDKLPAASGLAFGGDLGSARWYRKVPINIGTAELPHDTPRWRIELDGLGPGVEPMGLDVIGDTVIGRGRVGTEVSDLDFDLYGALEQGVSRRHAMLRPTSNHLYVIDLGSTNGTMHNGIPLGPGVARALKHNDTLTLGRFSFTIKIIDGPPMRKAPEAARVEPPPQPVDEDKTKPLASPSPNVVALRAAQARATRAAEHEGEPPPKDTSKLPKEALDTTPGFMKMPSKKKPEEKEEKKEK